LQDFVLLITTDIIIPMMVRQLNLTQFMENFNPATSTRLEGVEASLQLEVFDAERVAEGGVYFGLGLQNGRRQRYSAQVQVREAGLVSFGLNENGTFRPISQLPLSPVRVTLAIQRKADAILTFFVNGQQLDSSPALFALGEPVSVVLYTSGGDVCGGFCPEFQPKPLRGAIM